MVFDKVDNLQYPRILL